MFVICISFNVPKDSFVDMLRSTLLKLEHPADISMKKRDMNLKNENKLFCMYIFPALSYCNLTFVFFNPLPLCISG